MDTDDKVISSLVEDNISSEINAGEPSQSSTPTVKEPLQILSVEVVKEAEELAKPIVNDPDEIKDDIGNKIGANDLIASPIAIENEKEVIETTTENVLEVPCNEDSNVDLSECMPISTKDTSKNGENMVVEANKTKELIPSNENTKGNDQMEQEVELLETETIVHQLDEDQNNVISTEGQEKLLAETLNPNVTVEIDDETIDPNVTKENKNSTTGLSMLAQYGSEDEGSSKSDNDSVIEVPTSVKDYRNKVVEIDSDSDSSSSDSDGEYLNKLRKTIEKRMEVDDDEDEDDDDGDKSSVKSGMRKKPQTKIKAKGEFQLEDLPPIQDLQITVPEEECIVLGKIHSIVDQLVLVSALPDSVLVDLDTVLFLDKGQRVLGEVFDVLGQVSDPLYCVRFNSNAQINEKKIQLNDTVYLAPKTPYTQYIILSTIMKQKGSDASWENDIEPPPRFLDYSDDEEQQLARRQLRNKDRPVDHDDPQKRSRRETEEPQVSSHQKQYNNAHPRSRYPQSNVNNNGPPHRGSYGRPRPQYNNNNSHYRNPPQMPLNHNPSSWHSNYYPHAAYAPLPPTATNVQPYAGGFQRMPAPQYSQVPSYPIGMAYTVPPPSLQTQPHITPSNSHLNTEHQHFMPPNAAFNMRPPSVPGHYDMSSLPPGSQ